MTRKTGSPAVVGHVCHSDDMEPTITLGDIFYVDTAVKEFAGDGLYAICPAGLIFVKRSLVEPGGRIRLISDSRNSQLYPDQIYQLDEMHMLNIVGRVVGWKAPGLMLPAA